MTNTPDDLPEENPENSEFLEEQGGNDNQFDLSVPTGNLAEPNDGMRPDIEKSETVQKTGAVSTGDSYKSSGWKGLENEEPEEEEPPVSFGKKEKIPEDELDMTPMVDVTFLLLIFFMVTASFTLQKSIPQPPAASDDAKPPAKLRCGR